MFGLIVATSRPTHAQGQWQSSWIVTDSASNPVTQNADGFYTLRGVPTGSATNTYDPTLTAQALASPYAVGNGYNDDSVLINSYHPNKLEARNNASLAYLFGGISPQMGALSISAYAADYYDTGCGWLSQGFIPWKADARYGQYILITGSTHAEAKIHLSLTFTFTPAWVGSGPATSPAPKAPPSLNLLLADSLTSSAGVAWPVSASDTATGRKASATVSAPFYSEQSQAIASDDGSAGLRAVVGVPMRGLHLVQASVQGGVAQVYLDGQAKADAANPVAVSYDDLSNLQPGETAYSNASANASLSAIVRQDNRAVTISCPTIETSYSKGPVTTQYSNGQYPHTRSDADGSMQADSSLQWNVISGRWENSGTSASSGVPFTANAANFTKPIYSWKLTGGGSPDGMTQSFLSSNSQTVPLHLYFPDSGSVMGQSSTLQATATDADGASGAGTYSVAWHLPYEPTSSLGQTASGKHIESTIMDGVYPSASYDIPATEAKDFDVSAAFDAGEAITAAAGQEEAAGLLKVAATIAKLTNLKFPYGGDKASSGNRNDGTSWSVAGQDNGDAYNGGNISPPQIASDPNGWMNCKLSWRLVSKWHESSWITDKYTIHGYDSPNHRLVVHTTDMVDEEPYFVQFKKSDGTPVTGA